MSINKIHQPLSLALIFLLIIFMLFSASCSLLQKSVSAFERGYLAKPGMALSENPLESTSINHMFNAREGSVGGVGGAGGGCGCN